MAESPTPSYWDYLKLHRLLDLQAGIAENEDDISNDEMHFIVVHQAYELWFKLILKELRNARDHLAGTRVAEETVPRVVHHLGRVNEILKLLTDQFRVMETLLPQDFLDFRDKLIPASGFQSYQLREIEILLGLDASQRIPVGGVDPIEHIRQSSAHSEAGRIAWQRLEKAQREPTLRSVLHEWLKRTPIQASTPSDAGDEQIVAQFLEAYLAAYGETQEIHGRRLVTAGIADNASMQGRLKIGLGQAREFLFAADVDESRRIQVRRIRAAILFIESYRQLPLLAWPRLLLDTMIELEELLVLWRTRHARMVERTVGRRIGTGGSPGVEYLDQTTGYRVFTELWSVRSLLLPRQSLPLLQNPEFYGFAS